jgi:type IV pilus assembly protein PilY1
MKTYDHLRVATLTCILTGLMALGAVANLAGAASPTISDVPLAAAKRPNPNIVMSYDDSGSMDFEVGNNVAEGVFWWNLEEGRFQGHKSDDCSDYVSKSWGGTGSPNFNGFGSYGNHPSQCASDPSGTDYTWMMYVYLFPNGSCGQSSPTIAAYPCDARTYNDGGILPLAPTQQFAFTRSPSYNRMYYNPAITYLPWHPYNDGTTNCPSGTYSSTTSLCTPGNASLTSTLSHPVYGSSSSISNFNLFSNYTGLDSSSNPQTGFIFRMQPGMIMPAGPSSTGAPGTTKYRMCINSGSACGGWLAPGSAPWNTSNKTACLVNATITSCANGMGMPSGFTLSMTTKPTSTYSVSPPTGGAYDYVEAAITYVPGVYWKVDSTCNTTSDLTAGNCAYATDGQLIKKVDLKNGTVGSTTVTSFTVPTTRTDCAGGTTCTLAEEQQNFANWFQYYRKRTHMMSAALGNAFDGLHGLRAGYFRFSDVSNSVAVTNMSMYDLDSTTVTANGSRLIGLLYKVTGNASAGTPTRKSMDYLNQEYKRTDSAAPITNYCQFNAGLVMTDGFANGGVPATSYGNYDGNAPSTTYPYNKQYNTNPSVVITAPYADNLSNSMADIAMRMYTVNPRTDLTPTGGVPVDKSDVTPGADRNPDLHVNTYGMILNLTGRIFGNTTTYPNQNNDPYTYPPDWNSLLDVTNTSGRPEAIDELWHATINGRGQMLLASSPEETRDAVLTIVANIVSKGGAAAAVAVSNPNPVPGDNYAYASSYNSGSWSGDLNAYLLDLTTGQPGTTSVWNPSPQHLLAARDYTTRIIATYTGAAGAPFQWSSLTSTQQGLLGTSTTGPSVLAFLRGDRSKEGTLYRGRGPRAPYPNNVVPDNVAVLGDIVNAEPIYISAPRFSYVDNGYSAFKSGAAATRTKMVYQGANDGMLHAFDALTGIEAWAYIPNAVFPNLLNLSSKNAFVHKFYVDGTPVSGDVDFANTSGSGTTTPDWRTILVGSYGKGGRGVYALDVTNPTVTTESGLASKVLWEFPNNASTAANPTDNTNLGYSFGRPIIVQTRAAGWVVLVASGYNNGTNTGDSGGDGKGHLFVLNAKTGTRIADLVTGAGSTSTPSGLAYISAWVDHGNTDNTVESVYGGDLTGSVWRFDLSGTTVASWKVQLLTKLVDASSNAQPVTTEPELGLVNRNRLIFVGTGEYLGNPDVPGATGAVASATSTQTMYALRDPYTTTTTSPLTTPIITPLRSNLVQQTATNNASTGDVTLTTNAVDLTTKYGWYIDLPVTGERIVTNPALGQGVLAFTTNIPSGTDPCLPGGASKIYTVNYSTGGYIATSTSQTSGVAGKSLGNTLASRVQLIKLPASGNGNVVGLVRQSDASTTVTTMPGLPTSVAGKRKSWREINVQ